jgi:hypothetical protein
MKKAVLLAACLGVVAPALAYADDDRKAACYDKTDLAFDDCMKSATGEGAMTICYRKRDTAKADCNQANPDLKTQMDQVFQDISACEQNDIGCDTINERIDEVNAKAKLADPSGSSGISVGWANGKVTYHPYVAPTPPTEAEVKAQADAYAAQERARKLEACNKLPTTYGVIMCRWGL